MSPVLDKETPGLENITSPASRPRQLSSSPHPASRSSMLKTASADEEYHKNVRCTNCKRAHERCRAVPGQVDCRVCLKSGIECVRRPGVQRYGGRVTVPAEPTLSEIKKQFDVEQAVAGDCRRREHLQPQCTKYYTRQSTRVHAGITDNRQPGREHSRGWTDHVHLYRQCPQRPPLVLL